MAIKDIVEKGFENARQKGLAAIIEDSRFQALKIIAPKKAEEVLNKANLKMNQRDEIERGKYYTQIMGNPDFIKACEDAKVPVTKRQAAKFYRGEGVAWNTFNKELIRSVIHE